MRTPSAILHAPSTHRARCAALRCGTALILAALLVGAGSGAVFAAGGKGGTIGGGAGGVNLGDKGLNADAAGASGGGGGGGAASDGTSTGMGGLGGNGYVSDGTRIVQGGVGAQISADNGANGSDGTAVTGQTPGGGGGGGGGGSAFSGTALPGTKLTGGNGGNGGVGGDGSTSGYGGGGGGEGGHAAVLTWNGGVTNSASLTGGNGGDGGKGGKATAGGNTVGGGGGGGGDGGLGILFQWAPQFTNTGTIQGGKGGKGGDGGTPNGASGAGGAGGAGLSFANGGILTNSGSVTGGNGGANGASTGIVGANGAGGAGVVGAGLTITNSGTISGGLGGDGTTRANSISFTGGTNTITLGRTDKQSGLTGAIGLATTTTTLTIWQQADATLDQAITGRGSVTVATTGPTLTLTADSSYSGGTTVTGGTLQIGNGGTTGSIKGDVALGDGKTPNATLNTTLKFNRSDAVTFEGAISGTGGLTQSGSGTLTLTGANTYKGGTTLSAGTLNLGSLYALSTLGTVTFSGGTLQYSESNKTDYSSRFSTAANQAYNIDTNGQQITFATGLTSQGGTLTKSGGGTLMLTGTNTYSGGTTVTGGALQLGDGGTSGSVAGDVAIATGAHLTVYRSDTLKLAGAISGAGQLWKSGPGTLVLTGANTYSGGTTVSAGTLQIGDGGTTGALAGDVSLGAGTTLAVNRAGTLTLKGAISGLGALTKSGSGTLTLMGANTYSGGTTLTTGTLNLASASASALGTGTITFSGGTLQFSASSANDYSSQFSTAANQAYNIDTNGQNVTFATGLTSQGGTLTKSGSGTLTLTGTNAYTNTYSGATTVSGGTLEVDGVVSKSAITVNTGAVLAGTGKIGDPTINAGGTLAPGNAANPYGQLQIAESLTFQPGSFFNVNINAAGQASSVLVSNGGTVTINGGTVQVNAGTGTYAPNTAYTILTAAAGVTGRFVDPPTTNLAFLVPTLSYTGTTVVLNIAANQGDNNNGGGGGTTTNTSGTGGTTNTNGSGGTTNNTNGTGGTTNNTSGTGGTTDNSRASAAPDVPNYAWVAQNANQQAIGQALIHGGEANGTGGQILTAVNQLTVPEARAAFASMSGEGVQATQSVSVQTASLFNAALGDQMTGAGSSNSVTMTEAQPGFMALAIPAPHHVRELGDLPATRTAPPPPSFEQLGLRRTWHAWASGYGAWDNVHGTAASGTATQNTTVAGGAMGVDYQVTENYRLGLAVGGSSSSFDVPSLLTSGISNGGSIGLYNLARFGAFYGTGSFTFGYNSNKTTRVTGGFGGLATETLRAEFGSRILDARVEVGRDFQMASATLTPFMALDIADLRSNGFRESNVTGAGLLALAMAGQNTASVPGEIGLRYKGGLRMGTAMFAPFVEAAWVHDFAPQRSQTATLVNLPGAVFTVQGAQPAWNAARVKVGGELALSPTTKLFAAFNGRFSNSEQLYGGSGGIAWVW